MSISSATKSLDEDIETSHQTRAAGVSDIVKETHQTLESFNRECKERAKETRQTLENFKREREEKTNALRSELSSSEQGRKQEFATLIGNIKDEVATIENDTTRMLTDFRRDHREMTDALRSELSSSERDRRQEAATFQRNLHDEVSSTLAEVAADHREARTHWEQLSKTMSVKRARN